MAPYSWAPGVFVIILDDVVGGVWWCIWDGYVAFGMGHSGYEMVYFSGVQLSALKIWVHFEKWMVKGTDTFCVSAFRQKQ